MLLHLNYQEKSNKVLFENCTHINDGLVRLAGCKAYKNKLYTTLLTLYCPRNQPEKCLPFELICAEEIVTLNRFPVVTRKKWLPFEHICAVDLEYIITIHFVHLYLNLLTLYVQYTKTLAVKKWLSFEPICVVYLEYRVTVHFVRPYQNLLTLYV